jgi:hypothetical protein
VESFTGAIKDIGHLMYGNVITPSVGNMADQCRVFIKQIKLLYNGENMYKLESSITTRTILCSDDFYSTMPDPLLYSTMTKDADGNSIYIVTNPARKMELETIWSKHLNNDIAEWKKYGSYSKGMFGTVIGLLHDKVLSTCRQDKSRWSTIEADNDLISLISMLEKICAQNMTRKKVSISYGNLSTIEKCLAFKQRNTTTTTKFASQVNSMYTSLIHQNGKYAFGLGYHDLVLKRHSIVFKDYIALREGDTEQYDKEVQELIVSMLILKGSNHGRARTELQ